jgi:hypothetical protein
MAELDRADSALHRSGRMGEANSPTTVSYLDLFESVMMCGNSQTSYLCCVFSLMKGTHSCYNNFSIKGDARLILAVGAETCCENVWCK